MSTTIARSVDTAKRSSGTVTMYLARAGVRDATSASDTNRLTKTKPAPSAPGLGRRTSLNTLGRGLGIERTRASDGGAAADRNGGAGIDPAHSCRRRVRLITLGAGNSVVGA